MSEAVEIVPEAAHTGKNEESNSGRFAAIARRSTQVALKTGVTLFSEEFGRREDPAVLLVMGNSGAGLVWPDAFCEMIASHRYRVIRFDQRDTGLSSYINFDEEPYTLHHFNGGCISADV